MASIKVLFVGDVRGDIPGLISKLSAVNKKSGPFAAAFVIGSLLDASGKANGLPLQSDTPLPIYCLGAGVCQNCMGIVHGLVTMRCSLTV